ncbi:MAG: hypothetical protein OXC57_14820 [Rhodobacteraceae bacterium]|nr:hypothetical protein [Paracoccaceae bacterium]
MDDERIKPEKIKNTKFGHYMAKLTAMKKTHPRKNLCFATFQERYIFNFLLKSAQPAFNKIFFVINPFSVAEDDF